jgi:UDP-N-acetylglucosamine 2-epimerase (non-hydrolysing)
VLLTAHRREAFGEPLRRAFGAVRSLVERQEDLVLLYPVHPNPNVRAAAGEMLSGHPRIVLGEPLGYLDMIHALRQAALAITDSGGIQEEAPTFGSPGVGRRDGPPGREGVRGGGARLAGTEPQRISAAAESWLATPPASGTPNPYGDGRAGERIADVIISTLQGTPRRTADWSGP